MRLMAGRVVVTHHRGPAPYPLPLIRPETPNGCRPHRDLPCRPAAPKSRRIRWLHGGVRRVRRGFIGVSAVSFFHHNMILSDPAATNPKARNDGGGCSVEPPNAAVVLSSLGLDLIYDVGHDATLHVNLASRGKGFCEVQLRTRPQTSPESCGSRARRRRASPRRQSVGPVQSLTTRLARSLSIRESDVLLRGDPARSRPQGRRSTGEAGEPRSHATAGSVCARVPSQDRSRVL